MSKLFKNKDDGGGMPVSPAEALFVAVGMGLAIWAAGGSSYPDRMDITFPVSIFALMGMIHVGRSVRKDLKHHDLNWRRFVGVTATATGLLVGCGYLDEPLVEFLYPLIGQAYGFLAIFLLFLPFLAAGVLGNYHDEYDNLVESSLGGAVSIPLSLAAVFYFQIEQTPFAGIEDLHYSGIVPIVLLVSSIAFGIARLGGFIGGKLRRAR